MIFKNKKGWVARDIIVGLLLFSAVAGLFFVASTELATDYNETHIIDSSFEESYNQFQNVSGNVNEMISETSSPTGLGLWAAGVGIFNALVGVVYLIWAAPGVIISQAAKFTFDYRIPTVISSLVIPLLSTIVFVILIFVIISSINRGNKL